MSKHESLAAKGLTSPLGKSLHTAFSKTIDRMEARIREKSQPTVQVDRQDEILKAFNINLDSDIVHKSGSKHESMTIAEHSKVQTEYQGRNESAFVKEHRSICRRPTFHMMFTDPENENQEKLEVTSTRAKERFDVHTGSELGNFQDSDHSSDEDPPLRNDDQYSPLALSAVDMLDGISESVLPRTEKTPSNHSETGTGINPVDQDDIRMMHDVVEEEVSFQKSISVTEIQTPKSARTLSGTKSISSEHHKPKPMKFRTALPKNYADQTAAENREYALSMIGMPRPGAIDKVTARRFYIESCEQQKITPQVSHISKCDPSSKQFSGHTISERTTSLKGLGEKRLLALSRFIQDRLNEDGSHLILRESLIGECRRAILFY